MMSSAGDARIFLSKVTFCTILSSKIEIILVVRTHFIYQLRRADRAMCTRSYHKEQSFAFDNLAYGGNYLIL